MLSLDMTGEDTSKTGGTFLIEKGPDPSAVWDRPSDPHSEWGAGEVDRALVRGNFLNDLHLAVPAPGARHRLGGAHQSVQGRQRSHHRSRKAGVPAVLNWHFTDRYYHTNLDRLDKVSAVTMGHVAHRRGDDGDVPGVGRPDRRRAARRAAAHRP